MRLLPNTTNTNLWDEFYWNTFALMLRRCDNCFRSIPNLEVQRCVCETQMPLPLPKCGWVVTWTCSTFYSFTHTRFQRHAIVYAIIESVCSSLQQFIGSTCIKDKCQSGLSVYSHEQTGIYKAYLEVLGSRKSLL